MRVGHLRRAILSGIIGVCSVLPGQARATPEPDANGKISAEPAAAMIPALEVKVAAGPTVVARDEVNPTYSPSYNRGGASIGGSISYRSSYFIDPALEVSYAWLARGSAELPEGPWGDAGKLDQSLGAWVISPSISAQIWRIRPSFGLGLAIVTQSYEFGGEESSSKQFPLVSQLNVAFNALELDPIDLDVEAGVVVAEGAGIVFARFGIAVRFDVVSFNPN